MLWQRNTQSHPSNLIVSHVAALYKVLQLEKVSLWLRPRAKWLGYFRDVHTRSEEEMVLPPNTQLHVITIIQPWGMIYSILLWGLLFHVSFSGEGRAAWNWYWVPYKNAFIFLPFISCRSLVHWQNLFPLKIILKWKVILSITTVKPDTLEI